MSCLSHPMLCLRFPCDFTYHPVHLVSRWKEYCNMFEIIFGVALPTKMPFPPPLPPKTMLKRENLQAEGEANCFQHCLGGERGEEGEEEGDVTETRQTLSKDSLFYVAVFFPCIVPRGVVRGIIHLHACIALDLIWSLRHASILLFRYVQLCCKPQPFYKNFLEQHQPFYKNYLEQHQLSTNMAC